jgi:hypothetical protein
VFGFRNRKAPLQRKPLAQLEDLRDDCIALFLNSKMTMKQVHAQGGPTEVTIRRWLYKETRFPRMDTVRSLLLALGADMVVRPRDQAEAEYQQPIAARLGLDISVDRHPKMPPRKKARMIRKEARQRAGVR